MPAHCSKLRQAFFSRQLLTLQQLHHTALGWFDLKNTLSTPRTWSAWLACATCLLSQSVFAEDNDFGQEPFSVHAQSTYIWQKYNRFNALYSGPNSLSANKSIGYTFTADVALGARLWKGAELYLVPEATQGNPFSGLSGLGGFTNGEATRASGADLTLYRQKLFVRQTMNLSGATEKIDADFAQLSQLVSKNRIVVTAGNFSLLDIFDDNSYAKDPRTQFLNAGNMAYTAYDYASDARGFGWGLAAEWYQDDWVVRYARMTTPREPNQLPIDPHILKHYGDQLEIERGYTLGEQPGKARLLLWRNRMISASYQDAINYGAAHGTTPSIDAVRNSEQVKYGIGLNLEQAITPQIGTYMRAMWADGHSETMAFCAADRSLAVGVVAKGAAWHRPKDTLGLSMMVNTISQARKQYLQAGGVDFFIGDSNSSGGTLNYRPEQIAEVVYNAELTKGIQLSADYQYIRNPAYNRDRGPVNVFGLRLHAEY